ncbi:MAG TPA: hypothetical protein VGR72_07590 [Candidatus Acidoferrales bacterium]|nr:hypothetical protein [Candidatus Acidoferrales bacterium]
MTLIDELPASEKRRLLFVSRLRFGIESKIPRQKAVDKIVENALFLLGPEGSFTSRQIMEVFRDIGKVSTLRIREIEDGLRRLTDDGRVREHRYTMPRKYSLSRSAIHEASASYDESARRFDRVIDKLFGDLIVAVGKPVLASLFLEFVCEVFSALGAQWVSYLSGKPIGDLINRERVEEIVHARAAKLKLGASPRTEIQKRCVDFFSHLDPDFDYLKFTLGQSFYIVNLLGVEGGNLLSEEIFSGGKLYLDSSVVIPALLGESRHYLVFQELLKICKRLGITLLVARPTIDEVRGVAAGQERLAANLYDKVPEGLAPQVFGDFFQTYHSLKEADPNTDPATLFAPFQRLAETLRSDLGLEVVDDARFDKFPELKDFEDVKGVLQAASVDVRMRAKFQNALIHDAKLYLFLRSECNSPADKIWLVTRDSSLPKAWSLLQPHGLAVRCFLLDGLLQSISPFVVDDGELKDLSQVFSQVMVAQLVPQGKIFDIEDFLLLQDLEIDCNELPEDELRQGLLSMKAHVLKGAAYRREDFEEAAYEIRKTFARRDRRVEKLAVERDGLERKLTVQEASHQTERQSLQGRINELEAGNVRRARALKLLVKKVLFYSLLVASLYVVFWMVGSWGAGQNVLQKVAAGWIFFPADIVVMSGLGKVLLFRHDKLKDVFSFWSEVKELFK